MAGPGQTATGLDRAELGFLAARLSHPDVTVELVVDGQGLIDGLLFVQHQGAANVQGDARVVDPLEPVGEGLYELLGLPKVPDIVDAAQ